MNFPLLNIVFLLHSLEVTICVVHSGVFWDMVVGIHEGHWGYTFVWRGQRFFAYNSSILILCHITVNQSNQHPQGNIF